MKTVKNILRHKGDAVHAVTPGISVFDALKIMMEKNISALLVIEDDELKGIFTERDYARKVILQGKSSKETLLGDIMTSNPYTITSAETVENCMQTMTDRHFRHLPVVEDGKVIGIISIGDIVKHIIEVQKQTINELESYINS